MSSNYRNGLRTTSAYQVSTIPYASSSISVGTASVVHIPFYNITKNIVVRNDGANELRFGFSEAGVQDSNYVALVSTGESFNADFKIGDLYLIADGGSTTCTIIAGLTSIPKAHDWTNWSGSSGVG